MKSIATYLHQPQATLRSHGAGMCRRTVRPALGLRIQTARASWSFRNENLTGEADR